jgi:glycosyltransferase involved in cell wall biosynthesis
MFGEVRVNSPGHRNLHHIGNNKLHLEIYERALRKPDAIVLHDSVLQHFFLGTLTEEAYIAEFVYNYGEGSRAEAAQLWHERNRSGSDPRYFTRPLLRRITDSAKAVIVHNPASARLVREHSPAVQIFEIPHLFVAPALPGVAQTADLRRSIEISAETLLIGVFGYQRETKRLHVVLRAVGNAVSRGANVKLLVSGEFISDTFAKTLEPLLDRPHVVQKKYLARDEFWTYLAATDVCVNLRYPSAAESSGIGTQMMGIGKAVIFTRDEAIARIPNNACLRISTGPTEEDELTECILWLAKTGAASSIGNNAAQHIAQEHDPKRVAARYWDAVSKT